MNDTSESGQEPQLGTEDVLDRAAASVKAKRDYHAEYERRKKPGKRKRGRPPKTDRVPTERSEPSPPPLEPIDPLAVADGLQFFAATITGSIGVTALSREECEDGGKVFAPILDHYAPVWAPYLFPWGPVVFWLGKVTVPRVSEYRTLKAAAEAEAGDKPEGEKFRPIEETHPAPDEGVELDRTHTPAHEAAPIGVVG